MTFEQKSTLLERLALAQQARELLTYRQLIDALQLATPSMRRLTHALESLAAWDAQQERPLRSVLVVSQRAPALPRQGFFEYLKHNGLLGEHVDTALWHAQECERVYQFNND